jgi:hypothetical protein
MPQRLAPQGGGAMSLFEFTFGLSAVILGLALTHLASSFHRLAVAGRRVRWAPEPILLSGIIFLVIVSVWLYQWPDRAMSETTIGLMLIQVCKLLLPYLAAAFVLPEHIPESGPIDLYAHYDRTRIFTFGALIVGLLLFWVHGLVRQSMAAETPPSLLEALNRGPWVFVGIYILLIFVRIRWLNTIVLAGGLLYYGWRIAIVPLQG